MPDEPKPESESPKPPPSGDDPHAAVGGPLGLGGGVGIGLPILINLGPVINSLSPSGGTMGGNGFTLTVSGSRFASGATVMWNGAPRSTTFVSSTQLTASILPADIATAGQANVTVANPPPGATSGAAAFNVIPDITTILNILGQVAIGFTTLQQFQALQPALIQALSELRTYLTNQNSAIDGLSNQLSTAQQQNGDLTTQNANLNTQVTQQQATIAQLQAQLAATKTQSAAPVDVARSFKGVVDQIQQAAIAGGGVQTTLTNLQVQLKTLVSVQQAAGASFARDAAGGTSPAPNTEAVLVFPDPASLPDPNALSTVTFSFSAIPSLKPNPAPAPSFSATPDAERSQPAPAPETGPAPGKPKASYSPGGGKP